HAQLLSINVLYRHYGHHYNLHSFPTRRSSDLGQVRADQHRQQAEQAPHQAVDERQHPEMVPATLQIPQQNRSSLHETEFPSGTRSEEHTSELQSLAYLVCRLLLEKKKNKQE